MAKKFLVTLKKSLRGTTVDQREAVRCLGLRRLNSKAVIIDNPANRGQIYKVHHLVEVKVEK